MRKIIITLAHTSELPLSTVQLSVADDKITITGVPDDHVIDFVARTLSGKYVVGIAPKDGSITVDNYRLYIGYPCQLSHAIVNELDHGFSIHYFYDKAPCAMYLLSVDSFAVVRGVTEPLFIFDLQNNASVSPDKSTTISS